MQGQFVAQDKGGFVQTLFDLCNSVCLFRLRVTRVQSC